MKKFWSIFTVALVALSAVSCSNNYEDVATIEGNTLSFNVNIDNTRTALEQTEKGWNTVWVGNETLVVSDGEKSYNFTNTAENKNKFTCEAVGIRSLIGKNVTVVYNSVINSAEGAAGMTLTGAAESFSETVAIDMVAGNAFLKLTSEADVTLTASADIFGDGTARQNSIVVKGADVLVPVYAAAEITLTATIAEAKVKETVITLANNKIYNLGTIEEVKEPVQIMSAFNKVEYFAEPIMVGRPNIFMLAISDATGNSSEFYFYNETAFLSGEYPVITMEQMGTVPAALLGGEDMSKVTYGGITYNIVGGMVAIQTLMPDTDYNLVNFQLELEDANGNKAVITQGGESLISAFGYTGGAATSPLSLKDWGFTTYEATVDGTTVTLKSSNTSGDFVMVLSGVVDGNIAAADNFYVVGDNLSGYYFDALEGQFDFTEGGIWFEKMSDSNYQLFISPMYEWKIGNKWHVDNGLDVSVGLDIVVNFPVVEPVSTVYGAVGSYQNWDIANPTPMYENGDYVVAYNLAGGSQLKFVLLGKQWEGAIGGTYGTNEAPTVSNANTWHSCGETNILLPATGNYDVYYQPSINKYNIVAAGTTPEVYVAPKYVLSLCGTFNNWGDADMIEENGIYVAKNITMEAYASFKVRKDKAWTISFGGGIVYMNPNHHIQTYENGSDISITEAGTYDVYFNYETKHIYVMTAGTDYTTATLQTTEGKEPVQEEPEVTEKVVYLKPNANWKKDNARFAAYFFGGTTGEKWVSMTATETAGIYQVNLPEGYDYGCNIIFCRMNPSTTANNWNNKWNQTSDLKTPTDGKNLYTVSEGAWDKGAGSWSVK